MMRYFLVTYATPNGYGNLCMSGSRFPSQQFVQNHVMNQTGTSPVIVVHVFEFRSRDDFDAFQEKE